MSDPFNSIVDCMHASLWFVGAEDASIFHARFCAAAQAAWLVRLTGTIDAELLSCSQQDYQPHGASAAGMLAEPVAASAVAHLDASHICTHSYPDKIGHDGRFAHRLDLALATCGFTAPWLCLPLVLAEAQPALIEIDILRRGLTRQSVGVWCTGGALDLPALDRHYHWQTRLTRRHGWLLGHQPDQAADLRDLLPLMG